MNPYAKAKRLFRLCASVSMRCLFVMCCDTGCLFRSFACQYGLYCNESLYWKVVLSLCMSVCFVL